LKSSVLHLLLIVFCAEEIFAQDTINFNKRYVVKNNLSINLGGITGALYDVDYERNFSIKAHSFHTLGIGLSYQNFNFIGSDQIFLPATYSYSIGKRKSKFFMGMALNFLVSTDFSSSTSSLREQVKRHPSSFGVTVEPAIDFLLCPMIGYEFISKKRFYVKTYITAVIGKTNIIYYYVYPWIGFTFGFKLNKHL
jgi:hypothetical protein